MMSLIFLVVGLAVGYFGKNQIDAFISRLKTKAVKVETKVVEEVKAEVSEVKAEIKQKVKRAYNKKVNPEEEVKK